MHRVVGGESSRAINLHHILVILAYFNDRSSLVLFGEVWASVILDSDMVTNF